MKYIYRLLVFPFIFGIILVTAIRKIVLASYYFLKYGGEFVQYPKDSLTISDVFNFIADKFQEERGE